METGYRSIRDLTSGRNKYFYDDGGDLVGVRWGGLYLWHRWSYADGGYVLVGSTRTPGRGSTRHKITG